MTKPDRRINDDRGVGLISSMIAVPLVVFLMLFGAQILLRLHATGTVRAVAGAAARDMAVTPEAIPHARARTERTIREHLGPAGPAADIDWHVDTDTVTIRVSVAPPRLLRITVPGPLTDPIVESVSVMREVWR